MKNVKEGWRERWNGGRKIYYIARWRKEEKKMIKEIALCNNCLPIFVRVCACVCMCACRALMCVCVGGCVERDICICVCMCEKTFVWS